MAGSSAGPNGLSLSGQLPAADLQQQTDGLRSLSVYGQCEAGPLASILHQRIPLSVVVARDWNGPREVL
ncbi:hypothetical protein SPI_03420 [Niveomyces insectorum RCEF 264]|uniref:Uncharacterized protein n=1 Tax=Niveomyces insectorum RCEF 264 TaxID=1081102 RepID=A0A167W2J2_9HYPO|nr:hypothetical protein SPI_03420 [Niveomyces insectorum RCEF 264]